MGDVIRLTLQLLRGEFRSRGHIQLDVQAVPLVLGSAAALGQVVLNLLVNALQSFPPVPEPGSRDTADNLVTLRLFARGPAVCLEVEDNGVPIPKPCLAHLFDALPNRGQSGSESRLGLAISKRIVEELGGRIEAEQPREGGTRLRLVLSAAAQPAELTRASIGSPHPAP